MTLIDLDLLRCDVCKAKFQRKSFGEMGRLIEIEEVEEFRDKAILKLESVKLDDISGKFVQTAKEFVLIMDKEDGIIIGSKDFNQQETLLNSRNTRFFC